MMSIIGSDLYGEWERTPWLRRFFGKPKYRRRVWPQASFADWVWQYGGGLR